MLHVVRLEQRTDRVDRGGHGRGVSIEQVVLTQEDGVKGHADGAQAKFDGVAGDTGPVALHGRVEHELNERQEAAGEVQQDLLDAPAGGRLARVVDPHLRHVLDDRHDQLDVADGVDLDGR